ncbi:hypothetical protein B566_EDAN010250 [Ephemera danica]|nr:hypothetical protein B566_EDAN010250 [Ephemera danica]
MIHKLIIILKRSLEGVVGTETIEAVVSHGGSWRVGDSETDRGCYLSDSRGVGGGVGYWGGDLCYVRRVGCSVRDRGCETSSVGDAHVRLAHRGEGSVQGLAVSGHLSHVAEAAVRVLAYRRHSRGRNCHGGGEETSVSYGEARGQNQNLLENSRNIAKQINLLKTSMLANIQQFLLDTTMQNIKSKSVVDAVSVEAHGGNSGGSRVGNSEEGRGDLSDSGGSIGTVGRGGVGVGKSGSGIGVSQSRGGIGVSVGGCSVAVSVGGCSIGSRCGIGTVVGYGGSSVSESIVGDANVGLTDGGEGGVKSLAVGGDLSQVSVATVGVLANGSHRGSGVASGVAVSGGSGVAVRSNDSSASDGQTGGENNKLRMGKNSVVDAVAVEAHVGDSGGSRVGNSEEGRGGNLSDGGSISGRCGIGSVSHRCGVGSRCSIGNLSDGGSCVGGVSDGSSIGSRGGIGTVVGYGGSSVGESIVGDANVGLTDGGEGGVKSLAVGGDLSQVSVATEGVLANSGDGRNGSCGVGRCGVGRCGVGSRCSIGSRCSVTGIGSRCSVTGIGSGCVGRSDNTGASGSQEGGEHDKLQQETLAMRQRAGK